MRYAACLVVLLACLSGLARAEEPTRNEARFLKSLVTALAHESEDVRRAAEEALVLMGDKAAWYLVHDVKRVKPAARDAVARILTTLGASARAAIASLARLPSGDYGKLLAEVRDALEGGESELGFGESDPAVAARVDAIVSAQPTDSWSSYAPAIDELVALGRKAIPALVKWLDPARATEHGCRADWACSALEKLCGRKEIAPLGALVDDGWSKVARVFKGMDERRGVPYLIRAIERGQLTHDIGDALRHFADKRSRKPVVAYLEKHGVSFVAGSWDLMELCVALRAREAVPHLLRILRTPSPGEVLSGPLADNELRREVLCASALAALGEPEGMPILIAMLDCTDRYNQWLARIAGEGLERVTGRRIWAPGGDGAAAKRRYEAWWAEHEGHLVWDELSRRYRVER